eukprot:TRINITY_DN1594_c1_g1_i1.p1 TRINITY_DN1594_c1_g1~~TRINITY_DN1594_c1_g1_i1.p1  ORF type:complete len:342 (-),score=23.62 TRINITY_DN1594_c1_g1_i1:165-1190(-)
MYPSLFRFSRFGCLRAAHACRRFSTMKDKFTAGSSWGGENLTGKSITGFSVRESDVYQNRFQEYRMIRRYQGVVKAVILDWAGTVMDCGVYSPAVVFRQVFEKEDVPISMHEARGPMGAHKKVHIQKICEMSSVRERWKAKKGAYPSGKDVDRMFESFVPSQLKVLSQYSDMIPGAVDTVNRLRKEFNVKIGSTTGFTSEMVAILKTIAAKAGYTPDCTVAADEVPQARPYPFMVWLNAIRLNISPISAIVKVDDTADGVREGLHAGCWSIGLAKTGNYMAMNEHELAELRMKDPDHYERLLTHSYETLANAGAHYVIDDMTQLPRVLNDINRRLAQAEVP